MVPGARRGGRCCWEGRLGGVGACGSGSDSGIGCNTRMSSFLKEPRGVQEGRKTGLPRLDALLLAAKVVGAQRLGLE